MTPDTIIYIIGGVLTFLLSGNLWFIKRLVDKLEQTSDDVSALKLLVVNLQGRMDGVSAVAKEYPDLKTEVRVLAERIKTIKTFPLTNTPR